MNILLDMDGVLANFVGGAIDAHGADERVEEQTAYNFWRDWPTSWADRYEWGENTMSDFEFWTACSGHDFWAGLKPYSWTVELYSELRKIAPVKIVTAPRSRDAGCFSGKLEWLHSHLGVNSTDVVFTSQKWLLNGNMNVLIDDHDDQFDNFISHGGDAVIFPQAWNHGYQSSKLPKRHLDVIAAIGGATC